MKTQLNAKELRARMFNAWSSYTNIYIGRNPHEIPNGDLYHLCEVLYDTLNIVLSDLEMQQREGQVLQEEANKYELK